MNLRGVRISEEGLKLLQKDVRNNDKTNESILYEKALHSDLRAIGSPFLKKAMESPRIAGTFALQIKKIKHLNCPEGKTHSSSPRMIGINLTDGSTTVLAVEFEPVAKLKKLIPGKKIFLKDVEVRSNIILLRDVNVLRIAGEVLRMTKSWELKQDRANTVMKKFMKSLEDGEEPPPFFKDFKIGEVKLEKSWTGSIKKKAETKVDEPSKKKMAKNPRFSMRRPKSKEQEARERDYSPETYGDAPVSAPGPRFQGKRGGRTESRGQDRGDSRGRGRGRGKRRSRGDSTVSEFRHPDYVKAEQERRASRFGRRSKGRGRSDRGGRGGNRAQNRDSSGHQLDFRESNPRQMNGFDQRVKPEENSYKQIGALAELYNSPRQTVRQIPVLVVDCKTTIHDSKMFLELVCAEPIDPSRQANAVVSEALLQQLNINLRNPGHIESFRDKLTHGVFLAKLQIFGKESALMLHDILPQETAPEPSPYSSPLPSGNGSNNSSKKNFRSSGRSRMDRFSSSRNGNFDQRERPSSSRGRGRDRQSSRGRGRGRGRGGRGGKGRGRGRGRNSNRKGRGR